MKSRLDWRVGHYHPVRMTRAREPRHMVARRIGSQSEEKMRQHPHHPVTAHGPRAVNPRHVVMPQEYRIETTRIGGMKAWSLGDIRVDLHCA